MKKITQKELKVILEAHQKWLDGSVGGVRANLSEVDLSWADLSGADLSWADLSGADLSKADLSGANLSEVDLSRANLSGADLSRANLSGADLSRANLSKADPSGANLSEVDLSWANLSEVDLSRANLSRANLSGAYLSRANLSGAYLSRANLSGATLPHFQICPEEGDFVAWKAVSGGVVVKLLVPKEAKRTSSLVGRKCRAEFVIVLDGYGVSCHDENTKYEPGLKVLPDKYDDDIRVECTSGIHFFMTKREAEEYA